MRASQARALQPERESATAKWESATAGAPPTPRWSPTCSARPTPSPPSAPAASTGRRRRHAPSACADRQAPSACADRQAPSAGAVGRRRRQAPIGLRRRPAPVRPSPGVTLSCQPSPLPCASRRRWVSAQLQHESWRRRDSGRSPVPAQMWAGPSPSLGADVAGVSPSPEAGVSPSPEPVRSAASYFFAEELADRYSDYPY